jgi:hypothetical protein
LHESGYIHDPATKAKSVMLTEEGTGRSERLFEKHFMADYRVSAQPGTAGANGERPRQQSHLSEMA